MEAVLRTIKQPGPDTGFSRAFAALMVRAQVGDRDAFRTLLEKIISMLKGFLRKRISDWVELDEVCQEILLALYQSRHTYQPERPFEPWLFAIARNTSVDHVRRSWGTRRARDGY